MRCRECGASVKEGSKFCTECGAKIVRRKKRPTRLVSLVCEDCGGSMDMDENRNLMFCPFCGSKKIYFEEPEVKIQKSITERRKAQFRRDIEVERERGSVELEKKRLDFEKEKNDNLLVIICVIVAFLMVASMPLIFGALN